MRLIEFASDAQAQLDLLRKIYDCTFSAIAAQGKAKEAQSAAKKHHTTAGPKVKPNHFVKKPAAPIAPIAQLPAISPQKAPIPVAAPQVKPASQAAKLPSSLKPLPTSVLNPINSKLPTPNDLDKNQPAS